MSPPRVPCTVRSPDLLPAYQSAGASGMDLRADIPGQLRVGPGERVAVPTGLRLQLPPFLEAQVRPRSGLALASGLTVLNAPGTVDSDYRGEIRVILVNLGREPCTIGRGDRIAQMVFARVERVELSARVEIEDTPRGEGGFGSTGR